MNPTQRQQSEEHQKQTQMDEQVSADTDSGTPPPAQPAADERSSAIPEPALSSINIQVMEDFLIMVGGDVPEVANEFIDLFIDDATRYLASMRQALEQANTKQLSQAAHTLKSSSAQIGALTLSQHCQHIETLASDEALSAITSLVEQAEQEYERVYEALLMMKRSENAEG